MYTMSWSVAALVGSLMSGVVIDRWGAEWLWGLCAVIGTVAGAGYWALMRRVTDTDTDTDSVEGAAAMPEEVPVTVPEQVTADAPSDGAVAASAGGAAAAPMETSASALGHPAGSGRA